MAEADGEPRLRAVAIGGPAEAWEELGLAVEGSTAQVGEVALYFGEGEAGITGWELEGVEGDIDGLPVLQPEVSSINYPTGSESRTALLGAVRIDHVVVATPDVDRTTAAFEAAGIRLRRERVGEEMGRPLRQAFFRLGEVIAEVVGPPDGPAGDGPSGFWGLVLVVSDLDAVAERMGNRLGRVKPAVQPGRRIATVRGEAGLGLPVALLSERGD